MLDQTKIENLMNTLKQPRYLVEVLHQKAVYDFDVIDFKLARASVALSILRGADLERCEYGKWGSGVVIKSSGGPGVASIKVSISSQQFYKKFVIDQFFDFIGKLCSTVDVLGGLLSKAYFVKNSDYHVPVSYFHAILEKVSSETTSSQVKNFIQANPAILDYNHFLPTGTGVASTNIDLTDCNFSYQLIRNLRNVPEHNSYEKLIEITTSPVDHMEYRYKPEYFARISDNADDICDLKDASGRRIELWSRLARKKDSARDILFFGEWALQEIVSLLDSVIEKASDDLS